MNVPVPGENETFAFWVVVLLMASMLGFLVILFRRRGWL
jgi:Mg2+ and Co2+ transporter CorA